MYSIKKNFFYLCMLFVWSVGGAYGASGDKPLGVSCMAWLEQLETKRSQLLEQVKDKKSWDELQKYTTEISATIGGKYGISSTPATEQEREEIIRSIHKTRQIFLSSLNFTSLYLQESMTSKDVLSENSLREIAEKTQTDPKLLQNHLAAIAVVDGASFSFRVSDPRDSENIRRNILLTHYNADNDDLGQLLGPIFELANKPLVQTLIDTLEKVAKTEDAPLKTFLESPFYNSFIAAEAFERLERNDLALEALERAIKHPQTTADDLIRAANRLKDLGRKDRALEALELVIKRDDATAVDLICAAEAFERLERNDLALEALERAIKHPRASADDLIPAAVDLKRLERNDLALEALNRVINHPHVTPDNLIRAVDKLEGLGEKDRAEVLKRVIKHADATPSDLIDAANALKELKKPDLELQAWKKVIEDPYLSLSQLIEAARAFERLNEKGLAIKVLELMTQHSDVTPDDLTWAAKMFAKLPDSDLKKKNQQTIKELLSEQE